jgi:hypothetical protein
MLGRSVGRAGRVDGPALAGSRWARAYWRVSFSWWSPSSWRSSWLGFCLVVLKANPSNSIVLDVHGWARSLAGPFDDMFGLHNARVTIAVNWGIAAVVYLFVGGLIARLIGRAHR